MRERREEIRDKRWEMREERWELRDEKQQARDMRQEMGDTIEERRESGDKKLYKQMGDGRPKGVGQEAYGEMYCAKVEKDITKKQRRLL